MPRTLKGFTLLEVLIALLIFSLGLIGVAGLMVLSVQTNQGAYLRTQATFLAQSMADRMRANVMGIWGNNYNGTYTGAGGTVNTCLVGAPCSFAQVATRDTQIWRNQLAEFLPNPSARIACVPAAGTPPSLTLRPTYTGQCTIAITWNESALQQGGTATPTTLNWVFQP